MKSNPPAHHREGIRLKVLGPLALLMALVLVAALVAKSHSSHRAKPPGEEMVVASRSNVTSDSVAPQVHPAHTAHPPHSDTEPETDRLAALLFDKSTPFQIRRQSARSLAKIGTDQAMAAL